MPACGRGWRGVIDEVMVCSLRGGEAARDLITSGVRADQRDRRSDGARGLEGHCDRLGVDCLRCGHQHAQAAIDQCLLDDLDRLAQVKSSGNASQCHGVKEHVMRRRVRQRLGDDEERQAGGVIGALNEWQARDDLRRIGGGELVPPRCGRRPRAEQAEIAFGHCHGSDDRRWRGMSLERHGKAEV